MVMVANNVDLILKDKHENVISDTKRELLTKQKWFAELMANHRHQDVFLDYMLKCYDSAVKEKKHELFHLYDIRDALQKRFGSKPKTTKLLGITNKEWDMLGNLANHQPLEEGRHKGKNIENLRPATNDELKRARDLALSFIEKYLDYLEAEDD